MDLNVLSCIRRLLVKELIMSPPDVAFWGAQWPNSSICLFQEVAVRVVVGITTTKYLSHICNEIFFLKTYLQHETALYNAQNKIHTSTNLCPILKNAQSKKMCKNSEFHTSYFIFNLNLQYIYGYTSCNQKYTRQSLQKLK